MELESRLVLMLVLLLAPNSDLATETVLQTESAKASKKQKATCWADLTVDWMMG